MPPSPAKHPVKPLCPRAVSCSASRHAPLQRRQADARVLRLRGQHFRREAVSGLVPLLRGAVPLSLRRPLTGHLPPGRRRSAAAGRCRCHHGRGRATRARCSPTRRASQAWCSSCKPTWTRGTGTRHAQGVESARSAAPSCAAAPVQVAFVRVCSGRFDRGMRVSVARTSRTVALTRPQKLFGQDRQARFEQHVRAAPHGSAPSVGAPSSPGPRRGRCWMWAMRAM